jgi:hypothetical protein
MYPTSSHFEGWHRRGQMNKCSKLSFTFGSGRSWEEAVIARGLNNDTSVQGMKLKCTYFLKEVGG